MDRPFSMGKVLVRRAAGLSVVLIGVVALIGLASGSFSVASFHISAGLGPSEADASSGQAKKYCFRQKTKSKRRNCLKHWNPGPPLLASDISMVQGAACAVTLKEKVACWGSNYDTRVDRLPFRGGRKSPTHLPRELEGLENISRVILGSAGDTGCALKRTGTVLCWIDSSTPKEIPGLDDAVDVANGSDYEFCAVREGGTVVCWGSPFTDDCEGYDQCTDLYGFDQVKEIPQISDAVKVFVGDSFSFCAITESKSVFCWGNNSEGDFGNGVTGKDEFSYDPVNVPTLQGAKSLSLGRAFWGVSCVQFESDYAKCWGDGFLLNRRRASYVPVSIPSLGKVRGIVAPSSLGNDSDGGEIACAIRLSGRPVCWGANHFGFLSSAPILGNGTFETQYKPRRNVRGISDAVKIESSELTVCAIRATSQVLCWGNNSWRGLGLYANYQPTLPRAIRVSR